MINQGRDSSSRRRCARRFHPHLCRWQTCFDLGHFALASKPGWRFRCGNSGSCILQSARLGPEVDSTCSSHFLQHLCSCFGWVGISNGLLLSALRSVRRCLGYHLSNPRTLHSGFVLNMWRSGSHGWGTNRSLRKFVHMSSNFLLVFMLKTIPSRSWCWTKFGYLPEDQRSESSPQPWLQIDAYWKDQTWYYEFVCSNFPWQQWSSCWNFDVYRKTEFGSQWHKSIQTHSLEAMQSNRYHLWYFGRPGGNR